MALGAMVASDAGTSAGLAWVGAGAATFLVAVGSVVRSPAPAHLAVAVLGAMLLLRQDSQVLLAPLYGAGLLLAEELTWRSIELAGVEAIGRGAIGARAAGVVALVGVGGCAAAGVAIAVTAAPGRSVALTAVGAVAVVMMPVGIRLRAMRLARPGDEDRAPAG
jgi:hypothetical protein